MDINEALLIILSLGPRLKSAIFPSCFDFSLNPLRLYNIETVLVLWFGNIFSQIHKNCCGEIRS